MNSHVVQTACHGTDTLICKTLLWYRHLTVQKACQLTLTTNIIIMHMLASSCSIEASGQQSHIKSCDVGTKVVLTAMQLG